VFFADDSVAQEIYKMRMRTDGHKSTQKVYAMKLLSKFEMVRFVL